MSEAECYRPSRHWDGQDVHRGKPDYRLQCRLALPGRDVTIVLQIMLLRWITSLPRKDDNHRLCVFLVPTVALVDQQSEAIANQTSLRVRPYRGDLGMYIRSLRSGRTDRLPCRCRVLGYNKMDERIRRCRLCRYDCSNLAERAAAWLLDTR